MDGPSESVRAFMAAFVRAWPTADATELSHFFSEDVVYVNGPLPTVHGRAAVVSCLTDMMAMGGEVAADILLLLAAGPIVMTERVDYWSSHGRSASLRVAGVFEVRDGVITAWRDYFDGNEFGSQLAASR